MSEENATLQRMAFDALNRRDLDAYLALMDPGVEIVSRFVGQGPYVGHDGARAWWDDIFRTLPGTTFDVLEVRDLGERTLAIFRVVGHGAGGEPPFAQLAWVTANWRDGRVTSWCSHPTETDALEAVGLRE
jgi:ketosteroid isomerase-like protein